MAEPRGGDFDEDLAVPRIVELHGFDRQRLARGVRRGQAHLAKDGNGYIHPTQVRSISLREAARVQSFHDGYIFCGSPSEQWIQLGNAVPPVLAEAIARSFRRALERS